MFYRKIIHIDMDAFYASVEQRDNPQYRGKPLAVGRSEERGVVAAASYEARRYGIHSAMPSLKAKKLCPELIFVPGRMDYYKSVSAQIHEIFHEYTDIVEPIALDEAFLDVTENKREISLAVDIARAIKREIRDHIGLIASAGVSYNKFLAKIASDYRKPDGLCTIHPDKAQEFIEKLPIESFWGIGHVTARKMHKMGIHNGADLKSQTLPFLVHYFGKSGIIYYNFARGVDTRQVTPVRLRKLVGCERTYEKDLLTFEERAEQADILVDMLISRLEKACFKGHTLTLKIKFSDFVQKTKSITPSLILDSGTKKEIYDLTRQLLDDPALEGTKIRLLGLSLSNPVQEFVNTSQSQLTLDFGDDFSLSGKTL